MKRLTLDEAWETGRMREYTCQEEADIDAWLEGAENAREFIGPPRPPQPTWEEMERQREEEFRENSKDWGPTRRQWKDMLHDGRFDEEYGEND